MKKYFGSSLSDPNFLIIHWFFSEYWRVKYQIFKTKLITQKLVLSVPEAHVFGRADLWQSSAKCFTTTAVRLVTFFLKRSVSLVKRDLLLTKKIL